MRWQDREGSENVEDRRRGGGPSRGTVVGGGMVGVVIVVLVALISGDPRVLQVLLQDPRGGGGQAADIQREFTPAEEEAKEFVSVVLRDTEDVWTEVFARELGRQYQKPALVLFTGQVSSACGTTSSAVGPFYCPGDQKVYLDVGFFDEMRDQLKAQGDFAQAYVVAHEVGHHVQNLLGISDKVHNQQGNVSKEEYNDLSVRLELQADYFAGVFTHHAERRWKVLEAGDVEEALNCARAIGDDRLQLQAQGYVVPDSFTHGTSEQRARWFHRGMESGDIRKWNPFEVDKL